MSTREAVSNNTGLFHSNAKPSNNDVKPRTGLNLLSLGLFLLLNEDCANGTIAELRSPPRYAALGRHPGVAHDGVGAVGQEGPKLMGGERLLVNAEPPAAEISNACGIDSPGLTSGGERTEQPGLLPATEAVVCVHQTEKVAHFQ